MSTPKATPDFNNWGLRDYDAFERVAFWDAMGPWLAGKGYNLYQYEPNPSYPDIPPRMEAPFRFYSGPQELPYGLLDDMSMAPQSYPDGTEAHWEFGMRCRHRFRYAQDSMGRHVVIKPVRGDTNEIKIFQRLKANLPLPSQPANFAGIVPILDILPYDQNFFVIMPRWGDIASWEVWYKHNYEVLDLVHHVLKGLVALHDNRIYHSDLQEGNILCSFAGMFPSPNDPDLLRKLREDQKLVYGINDFDVSSIFPLDTSLKRFRVPTHAVIKGAWELPYGLLAGELDFNPFACDVGCLGIYFCDNFQHLASDIPFLAPLLDGMVTADVDRRLSAREALDFFEVERANLATDQLQKAPAEIDFMDRVPWNHYDRWEAISPALKIKWSQYRMRKPSWWARQLQALNSKGPLGVYTLYYFRRFERYLSVHLTWILRLIYYG